MTTDACSEAVENVAILVHVEFIRAINAYAGLNGRMEHRSPPRFELIAGSTSLPLTDENLRASLVGISAFGSLNSRWEGLVATTPADPERAELATRYTYRVLHRDQSGLDQAVVTPLNQTLALVVDRCSRWASIDL